MMENFAICDTVEIRAELNMPTPKRGLILYKDNDNYVILYIREFINGSIFECSYLLKNVCVYSTKIVLTEKIIKSLEDYIYQSENILD